MRIVTAALTLVLLLGLASCGIPASSVPSEGEPSENAPSVPAEDTPATSEPSESKPGGHGIDTRVAYPPEMPALVPGSAVYAQDLDAAEAIRGNEINAQQQLLLPSAKNPDTLIAENRLCLTDDGAYRLIKGLSGGAEGSFSLVLDFTGTYEKDSDTALTLSPARAVTAYIDWAAYELSYPEGSGVFTGADSTAYSRSFNGPYIGDNAGNYEMRVSLDTANGTFEITGNGSQMDVFTISPLETERDGLNIYGVRVLPTGYAEDTRFPVVIFSHGFIGNNLIQRDVAYTLAEYGIASYCFDYCGGAPNSSSDGDFYDMSMLTEVEDLHAVVDMILEQPFTDPENVYIFGESMGGAVGSLVAAQRPEDIKGMMHFYPAYSISEQTRYIFASPDVIPERVDTSVGVKVGSRFYADAWTIDIYPDIAPYTGPVLMFQGTSDVIVPAIYVENAADVYENAELILYEGEGHGFTRPVKMRAVAKMIAFVQKHSEMN
ncbi:MAG: lysophospholipase [Oscillospiraceae bacterium]|nr:lysophospholipase [Oscillospiraceae bacterium]